MHKQRLLLTLLLTFAGSALACGDGSDAAGTTNSQQELDKETSAISSTSGDGSAVKGSDDDTDSDLDTDSDSDSDCDGDTDSDSDSDSDKGPDDADDADDADDETPDDTDTDSDTDSDSDEACVPPPVTSDGGTSPAI